ncbi:MAG: RCC1 domain-containing protein [Sandaracinaceae bacterium]
MSARGLAVALALSGCMTGGRALGAADGGSAAADGGERSDAGRTDGGAPSDAGRDAAVPVGGDAIAASHLHTCVVTMGALRCSGANDVGQLGYDGADALTPGPSPLPSAIVGSVSAGRNFTCVLDADGSVWCFGANDTGQLGAGDRVSGGTPRQVLLSGRARTIDSSFNSVCALVTDGSIHCWGSNQLGQLGTGSIGPVDGVPIPEQVPLPGPAFRVAIGLHHACAILQDGGLYCWGNNVFGELGLGTTGGHRYVPARVGTGSWREVDAGQHHTCAIDDAGALSCWGEYSGPIDGYPSPLGHDVPGSYDAPERVGTEVGWTHVSTDTFHTCALKDDGELWCWGRNAEGQLGVGSTAVLPDRTQIEPTERFVDVDVGRFTTCARTTRGEVRCAGANNRGALATGDTNRRSSLTPWPR